MQSIDHTLTIARHYLPRIFHLYWHHFQQGAPKSQLLYLIKPLIPDNTQAHEALEKLFFRPKWLESGILC